MCGIVGQLNFNKKKININKFKQITKIISHRGPDDIGVYTEENLALGNTRLSIFDLSIKGHMPMISKNGRFIISYNGEIYNWKEIRKRLKFINWKSNSDTETILYAYIEMGPKCLDLFKGMFAISIWDKKRKELFLARDREAIKPLFYSRDKNNFFFSSEIKSLILAGIKRELNYEKINDFLRWGLIDHSKDTLYSNIFQIDPGQYFIIDQSGKIKTKKYYYELKDNLVDYSSKNHKEISNLYFNKLNKIIELYSRSDVKIGTLLSGGVDSSIITALTAQNYRDDIETFTYDFKNNSNTKNYGESKLAKNFSDRLNIKNNTCYLSAEEVPKLFEEMMYFQELPITSLRVLADHKLFKLAKKKGFSVLISGDGGDQVAGGFEYYWIAIILDTIRNKGINQGEKLFKKYINHFGLKKKDIFKKIFNTFSATLNPGTTTTDGTPYFDIEVFNNDFIKKFRSSKFQYNKPFDADYLNFQYIDFKYHGLRKVLRMKDRASMATGLEVRVPLLDTSIVEFGFSTPHDSRAKEIEQRYYMVQAANKYLNKIKIPKHKISIVDNQRQWLKNELKDWVGDIIHSVALKEIGIFNVPNIKKKFNIYCKNKINDTSYNLFQIVNIGYWYHNIFKKKIF
tara:strand:+ start:1984 stop:3864 length:1881 start_codon:yes stop_codon:yes gene_type:complete